MLNYQRVPALVKIRSTKTLEVSRHENLGVPILSGCRTSQVGSITIGYRTVVPYNYKLYIYIYHISQLMEVGIPWFYRFFSPGIRHVRRVLATLLSPDSPGSGGESLPTEAPGLWGRVVGRVAMGISLGYAVSMVNLWLIYG